jgi:protein-L-isoaspartate(D-aspartate) O-methyltransferase
MAKKPTRIEQVRAHYARQMAAASGSADPRIERAFGLVPREAFLPPGPWSVIVAGTFVRTPTADPAFLYQNALIAIDAEKGINNGEPFLHAAWIGAVAPRPGESVVQIGAGGGYYTAVLAVMVLPDGKVTGIEVDKDIARHAKTSLAPFENVTLVAGDAVTLKLPPADIIYVNAGLVAPPVHWLHALNPGGRIIFPWRPTDDIGLAVMATRTELGFAARIVDGAWFIPCTGASDEAITVKRPEPYAARHVRSLVLTADREPDDTAIAIYPDLWFSSEAISL